MATVTAAPSVMHVATPAVQQNPPPEHPATQYKNVFTSLGVLLIIAGVLSFILGGVALSPSIGGGYYYVGSGMWGGGWYIASGALAIATGVRANSCNVISGMVVSILTCLVAFGVGIVEAVAAGICGSYYYRSYTLNCQGPFVGIHATIACIAFISFILAIVHSSFCCCGGCGQRNYQGQVLTATVTTIPTMQVQQGYATGHPVAQTYYSPVAGQQQIVQGQQFAAYPPAVNQGGFAAAPTTSYGIQPQPQPAGYAPPAYSQAPQQKQALQ